MLARFRLRLNFRAETELGTFGAYAAINFQYETFAATGRLLFYSFDGEHGRRLPVDRACLYRAPVCTCGKTNSLFSTFTGYGGGVINDDIIGYGPYGTHQFRLWMGQ